MNTCRDIQAHVAALADGEIEAAMRPAISAHVAVCEECSRQLAGWRHLRSIARQGLSVSVPAGLEARIRGSLGQARRNRSLVSWSWTLRVSAAAAAIMLAIVTGALLLRPDVASMPVVRLSDFVNVHALCAVDTPHDPRHAHGSDPYLVANKLRKDENLVAAVPNMSRDGYRLDGMCNCLHVGDARTVHTFYRPDSGDGPVLSLFSISQTVALADAGQRYASRFGPRIYSAGRFGDSSVVEWSENGSSFALVANVSLTDALQIADSIDIGNAFVPESGGSVVR